MNSSLHLDFETFSYAPLRVCGGYAYARHPSTEILCACWAVDEEEVCTWVPWVDIDEAKKFGLPRNKFWFYGPVVPLPLFAAIASGMKIIAHNAAFERAIWQSVVVKKHGGPPTKRAQFVCTAARAAAANLPRSLDGVGMALDTKQQKDTEGSRLLKLFAMPRKPTKSDDRTRIRPLDSPDEFKNLCLYCAQDVRTERDVDKLVPELHPMEQKLFAFDMLINERGIRIDIPLVRKASIVLKTLEADIVAEVQRRTKCEEWPEGLRPTQRDKMMRFFESIGVFLENMQADHVRKYLRANVATLPALARELLLLRIEAGKSSTKKFVSMLAYAGDAPDHRARGTLLFNGASTGRWSGKGVQPHNFIRGTLKYPQQLEVFQLLQLADHEVMSMLYEWPISVIGGCMRGFIIPADGKILRVVDYASIEARVLAWLAQEEWVLKVYASGANLYKAMAAAVFNIPGDPEDISKDCNEYKIGKNLVLGCLGADTKVMTRDSGWVLLDGLAEDTEVWDGVEWVRHEGLAFQGFKKVIRIDGVWLTPDHLIKIGDRWVAAETLSNPGTLKKYDYTFDILNCGPRHQFVVESSSGMMLVHNCGYGLGGAKFVAYSEKAGVEITEAFAKKAVKDYRSKHRKIVQFWYDVERCAIAAVREKRSEQNAVVLRNLKFYIKDQWFCIELPSGRCLRYYRPKVVPVEKFGEPALQLQFKTEFRGRLVSESTYGGKLVENIVQATARDLLVNGMFCAEEAGYPVYGTVHDEIITETDPGFGSVKELEHIVCALPWWGVGLPVAAEGFESYRYRK